jgi:hypothetical protein
VRRARPSPRLTWVEVTVDAVPEQEVAEAAQGSGGDRILVAIQRGQRGEQLRRIDWLGQVSVGHGGMAGLEMFR